MKTLAWAFATAALASAPALADQVNGPDYTPDSIRAFPVAGIHLGMTADEAAEVLKDAGYEGRFPKLAGTEHDASVWVRCPNRSRRHSAIWANIIAIGRKVSATSH